jgi:hypothetical protein
MLDRLKKTYKSGLNQCGVDKSMIKENTKAIEDMVAKLKQAYNEKIPNCGGVQEDIIAVAAKNINVMDRQATSITAAKTMSLMDDAAVGSPSFTNLVMQLQQQQREKDQEEEANKTAGLREKSNEAVEEMLQNAKGAYAIKINKINMLKKRRRQAQPSGDMPKPETYIVPINMPRKTQEENAEEAKS